MASAENLPVEPTKPRATAVAPVWHTIVFVIVIVGLSVLQSQPRFATNAAQLPSRIPLYIFTMCFELVLVGYVWLLGLRLRKTPIRELIGGRWQRWGDFWRDVGVAFLFWLVVLIVVGTLSYLLKFNGSEAAKFLIPQKVPEMVVWVLLAITAGFSEELLFRGYLQRQFLAMTQSQAAAVALQAIVFGVGHSYQGSRAVIVISVYGALFGALAAMRKSLRPGMMQHATQDGIGGFAERLQHLLQHLSTHKSMLMVRF